MKAEEKTHLDDLYRKHSDSENKHFKYGDLFSLFEEVLCPACLIAPLVMAVVGMFVTLIGSWIDLAVSGKIAVVFSYFTFTLAIFIPVVFGIAWHYKLLCARYNKEVTAWSREIDGFKRTLGFAGDRF